MLRYTKRTKFMDYYRASQRETEAAARASWLNALGLLAPYRSYCVDVVPNSYIVRRTIQASISDGKLDNLFTSFTEVQKNLTEYICGL